MSDTDATPTINASPTKEFFIDILVRDVSLIQAISELVDNSVDGAKRIRQDRNFRGLRITIQYDKSHFLIYDNCGGIPVDIAVNHAFRFGHIEGGPATPFPVGQFGVGMKRALFKMGSFITINSIAPDSSFFLEIDVEKWKKQSQWKFKFTDVAENQNNSLDKCETKIEVTRIHDPVAPEFQIDNFFNRLVEAVRAQNAESLQRGLKIKINDLELKPIPATLLTSESIKPIHVSKTIKQQIVDKGEQVDEKIEVELYAGLGQPMLAEAGWYVFCNGRLILKADQTSVTGWGVGFDEDGDTGKKKGRTKKIPRAHYQFARFRGYIYFTSENASILPWNTTKSGIDTGSPVYQAVKWDMIAAMRQVIDFLNKLKKEEDRGESRLLDMVSQATEAKVTTLPVLAKFVHPTVKSTPSDQKTEQEICYSKPIEEFERVKKILGVSSPKKVGEKTFDYFLNLEGDTDA